MTSKFATDGSAPLLLGGAFALGLSAGRGAAEELRIGFLAPTTGIFAQVGKDMVDGFQMYLDEIKNDFGGAQVKFIVEDEQGKPRHRRHQGQEADPAGQGAHVRRRPAGLDRLCARAGQHAPRRSLYVRPVPAADDLTQRDLPNIPTSSAPAGRARSRAIRSANGPASRATRRSSPSAPTMPSATRWSAASSARSRPAAGRSSRRSGRRSAPRISARTSRPSRRTPTRSSR